MDRDIAVTTYYISNDLKFAYEVRDRANDETLKRGWGYPTSHEARLAGLEIKDDILKQKEQ